MSLAAEPRPSRRALARIASSLLALSVAAGAVAAPVDANHRFERIGFSVGDVAAVVPVTGQMRAIVVTRGGEVYRVAGDRHVLESLGTIPASVTCATDGVLGAAWDHVGGNSLFALYTATSGASRVLRIARFDIVGGKLGPETKLLQPQEITIPAAAGCANLGGGIVVANDGRVLFGVGDMTNGPAAGQPQSLHGKIMRVARTGGAAPDNPNPNSPLYALGVRDPFRMAVDRSNGRVWFVDRGATQDELNWIDAPSLNFAWPRATGAFETNGFRDPAHTWTTLIGAVGLAVNNGSNFGNAWAGDVLVTTATNTVYRVHPVDLTAAPPNAVLSTIFTAGGGDPSSMAASYMPADGYHYQVTPGGEFFRLRNENSLAQEPSDRDSILPTLVRKLAGGSLEILTERETQAMKYGFYPGTIGTWYSHFDAANPLTKASDCATTTGATQGCVTPATSPGSAWATITMTPAQVDAMPENAYFVLSTINDRTETVVGYDSELQLRPGGDQTFGCPCPPGTPSGASDGSCLPNFEMNTAIVGASGAGGYNEVSPFNIPDEYDCKVIMLELSMEWCPPCRAMAAEAEALYQSHIGDDFMMIHVLSEDQGGAPAMNPGRLDIAERWTSDFGLTFPVVPDDNYELWGTLAQTNSIPQIFIIGKDGVVTDWWQGYQSHATVEAAIQRELAR